jgi:hypothetical protein
MYNKKIKLIILLVVVSFLIISLVAPFITNQKLVLADGDFVFRIPSPATSGFVLDAYNIWGNKQ